jgi:hypothetical protein
LLGGYLNFFLITSSSRWREKTFGIKEPLAAAVLNFCWSQRTSGSGFLKNPLVEEPKVLTK